MVGVWAIGSWTLRRKYGRAALKGRLPPKLAAPQAEAIFMARARAVGPWTLQILAALFQVLGIHQDKGQCRPDRSNRWDRAGVELFIILEFLVL